MAKWWIRQMGSAALGGYEFDVYTDGEVVKIRQRSPLGNSFKVKRIMTVSQYESAQQDWHSNDRNWFVVDPRVLCNLIDGND